MEDYVNTSASPWWAIALAVGLILVGGGFGIFIEYYRQHTPAQDNFYFWLTLVGAAIAVVSIVALWPT